MLRLEKRMFKTLINLDKRKRKFHRLTRTPIRRFKFIIHTSLAYETKAINLRFSHQSNSCWVPTSKGSHLLSHVFYPEILLKNTRVELIRFWAFLLVNWLLCGPELWPRTKWAVWIVKIASYCLSTFHSSRFSIIVSFCLTNSACTWSAVWADSRACVR